jgi:hypothetical protein
LNVTPQTNYADLLGSTNVKFADDDKNATELTYQEGPLIKLLQQNKTVVLNGDISPSLYQQLVPLLTNQLMIKPSIWLNGKLQVLAGKLLVVTSCTNSIRIRPFKSIESHYTVKDYVKAINEDKSTDAIDLSNLSKLQTFYKFATAVNNAGEKQTDAFYMSYARVRRCLKQLKNPKRGHLQNPLKSVLLFDYRSNKDSYAYLNVIGKMLFAPLLPEITITMVNKSVARIERLLQLYNLQSNNITADQIEPIGWRLLNCIDVTLLRKRICDFSEFYSLNRGLSLPSVPDNVINMLLGFITSYIKSINNTPNSFVANDIRSQTLMRFESALQDSQNRVHFLQGKSGVGKTYLINKLNANKYIVYRDISSALKHIDNNKRPILVFEEGNMYSDGFFDLFKCLGNDEQKNESQKILYNKQEYVLPANLHIVVTGNPPENTTGRNYHRFLQDYADNVWLKPLNEQTIQQNIVIPLLTNARYKLNPQECEIYASKLLSVYKTMSKYIQRLVTLRDVISLTQRFVYVLNCNANNQKPNTIMQAFNEACINEFAYGISDYEKRGAFREFINSISAPVSAVPPSNTGLAVNTNNFFQPATQCEIKGIGKDIFIPSRHKEIVNVIQQDIALRNLAVMGNTANTKSIVLLQGSSGVGKSTVLRSIIQAQGFSENHQDLTKRYYAITGKCNDAIAVIQKAATDGSIVVLDEWNVANLQGEQNSFEESLNKILDSQKSHPGFMILASQNSFADRGRSSCSKSDLNRTHFLHYDNFTDDERMEIAASCLPKNVAQEIVDEYKAYEKDGLNMRSFFNVVAAAGK